MAQPGSGRSYALNPFAAGGAPGVSKTKAYADGLRDYAGGQSVNEMAATSTPAMAAHLSQGPTFGAGGEDSADYAEVYRGLKDDPKAASQAVDIDRIWRATPNASIFKSGYEHNPYVEEKVAALRASRIPPPSDGYRRLRGQSDGD